MSDLAKYFNSRLYVNVTVLHFEHFSQVFIKKKVAPCRELRHCCSFWVSKEMAIINKSEMIRFFSKMASQSPCVALWVAKTVLFPPSNGGVVFLSEHQRCRQWYCHWSGADIPYYKREKFCIRKYYPSVWYCGCLFGQIWAFLVRTQLRLIFLLGNNFRTKDTLWTNLTKLSSWSDFVFFWNTVEQLTRLFWFW